MLFADAPTDGRIAFLMALATVVGGAAQWVVAQVLAWVKEGRAEKGKQEATIVAHLENLVVRLDREKAEQERDKEGALEEVRKLLARVASVEVRTAEMRSHIRYLESVLARNGHSFERWDDPKPDTGSHAALPAPSAPVSPVNPKPPGAP